MSSAGVDATLEYGPLFTWMGGTEAKPGSWSTVKYDSDDASKPGKPDRTWQEYRAGSISSQGYCWANFVVIDGRPNANAPFFLRDDAGDGASASNLCRPSYDQSREIELKLDG